MKVLHEIPWNEMKELDRIGKRCAELHVRSPMYATVELEVKKADSGLVVARYADLSRSWTRNYYNFVTGAVFGCGSFAGETYADGSLATKRTSGDMRYGSTDLVGNFGETMNDGTGKAWRGAAGDVTNYGIMLGRGTGAESIDDYVLGTPILEGTGTNQMQYQAMGAMTASWSVGSRQWTFTEVRQIINNSGNTISVGEIGLYGRPSMSGQTMTMCFVRDKLTSAVDVAHLDQAVVTYTMYSPVYP